MYNSPDLTRWRSCRATTNGFITLCTGVNLVTEHGVNKENEVNYEKDLVEQRNNDFSIVCTRKTYSFICSSLSLSLFHSLLSHTFLWEHVTIYVYNALLLKARTYAPIGITVRPILQMHRYTNCVLSAHDHNQTQIRNNRYIYFTSKYNTNLLFAYCHIVSFLCYFTLFCCMQFVRDAAHYLSLVSL